jgi:hypothetical protein
MTRYVGRSTSISSRKPEKTVGSGSSSHQQHRLLEAANQQTENPEENLTAAALFLCGRDPLVEVALRAIRLGRAIGGARGRVLQISSNSTEFPTAPSKYQDRLSSALVHNSSRLLAAWPSCGAAVKGISPGCTNPALSGLIPRT